MENGGSLLREVRSSGATRAHPWPWLAVSLSPLLSIRGLW